MSWRLGLPSHLRGGIEHGANHLVVAGAAAEIAGNPIAHLGLGGVEGSVQQRLGSDQQPRRAEAALERRGLREFLLYGVELAAAGEALDGLDRMALGLDAQHQAGAHQPSVEDHTAGATVAGAAAFLAAGEIEFVAEYIQESLLGLAEEIPGLAVDDGGNVMSAHWRSPARSKAMAAARRASTP